MNANKKTARMAGFHYFMYFLTSIIANMFGRFVFVDSPVTVMDPKNWTLPLGVELRTRKEVQNAEETQEF